jgi:hypothetical protein
MGAVMVRGRWKHGAFPWFKAWLTHVQVAQSCRGVTHARRFHAR